MLYVARRSISIIRLAKKADGTYTHHTDGLWPVLMEKNQLSRLPHRLLVNIGFNTRPG
jgi:hypothetical protein